MNIPLFAGLMLAILGCSSTLAASPKAKCTGPARDVTITRDDWGVAHVKGRSDADAIFGMIYAQAEDDFDRIESNYLVSLGRMAEAEGEGALWRATRAPLGKLPSGSAEAFSAKLRVSLPTTITGSRIRMSTSANACRRRRG